MRHAAAVRSRGSKMVLSVVGMARVGVIAGVLASVFLVAQRTASADEPDETNELARSIDLWKKVDGQFRIDPYKLGNYNAKGDACKNALKEYEGKPPSVTFVLMKDVPGLKAGTHPWTAAKPVCEAAIAAVIRDEKIKQFALWVSGAQTDAERGNTNVYNSLKLCLQAYDDAIALGASPTEFMRYYDVNMTMQAGREFCAQLQTKVDATQAAREAPYRKVLKKDKLSMAIEGADYLFMPGGGGLTIPLAAKYNVWFKDVVPDRRCTDGREVHILHRYQFNTQQELAKVTDREFCGPPPTSAFR